ncbi:MAG: bifunctional folylpolyglutamate synthase/dihydrofolate synthase [Bacteroidales bacterium]|jgi:dihydrofolate synthase/folylpolyglutamate synthase|nr:bifunctional folylpolyglutamate synthase/dihydrofolate synthase [Bacteroidales bacterium]
MNYQETLNFLYAQLPVFETQGAHAYKPGLERCEAMDKTLGHPHREFRTIHVAGTNGKGSCSHTLASILQCAGYKVGLFTSPHLLDFDERIRVNGTPIDHNYVTDWVEKKYPLLKDEQPSFFELATMMAFCYFAEQKVDVAVIEVGLGGRLDSTNIIQPEVSVITNISFDHMQFLGDTLPQIAAEKAGIMKAGVPCIIGECDDDRVRFTFQQNAQLHQISDLVFAADNRQVLWVRNMTDHMEYDTLNDGTLQSPLMGACQPHNANTVLWAVHKLRERGFNISEEQLHDGFRNVLTLTHLRGRWETLQEASATQPQVICDTGHNEGCFQYLGPQLKKILADGKRLHIVFGMVRDKDISAVLKFLPTDARYYFCNADTPRALPAAELRDLANGFQLTGDCYATIEDAYLTALTNATPQDVVFVGGSNFIVCEVMKMFEP